jgi:hypothetical protein
MTDSEHDDTKPEVDPRLNRRLFLARLGAAAGVTYAAPSVLYIGGRAEASPFFSSWNPFSWGGSSGSCFSTCQPSPKTAKKEPKKKK